MNKCIPPYLLQHTIICVYKKLRADQKGLKKFKGDPSLIEERIEKGLAVLKILEEKSENG